MKKHYVIPVVAIHRVKMEMNIADTMLSARAAISKPWGEEEILGDAPNNTEGGDVFVAWK